MTARERREPRDEQARGGAESGPPFEESLERLERVVEELEGGSLTLEESIARYEEGVRLSRRLTVQLDEAEKRIERLVGGDDATPPTTAPMDLEAAAEAERSRGRAPLAERRPPQAPASKPDAGPGERPPAPDELPF